MKTDFLSLMTVGKFATYLSSKTYDREQSSTKAVSDCKLCKPLHRIIYMSEMEVKASLSQRAIWRCWNINTHLKQWVAGVGEGRGLRGRGVVEGCRCRGGGAAQSRSY